MGEIPDNCPTRIGHECFVADRAAEAAASKAIREVFATMGVDVNDPQQMESFRRDFRFAGDMRKTASHGMIALVGALAAAIGGMLWVSFTQLVKLE